MSRPLFGGLGAGAPAAARLKPSVTAAAQAPVADKPLSGVPGAPGLLNFTSGSAGPGAARIRRRLMQLQASNAYASQGPLWQAIAQLQQQGATFDPSRIAAQHAGDFEALDDSQHRAEGALTRSLAQRGLTDSTAMTGGLADLAARGAAGRAGLVRGIYGEESGRQLQAQAMLRDLLMAIQGKGTQQAASIADSMRQEKLARDQMNAAGGFGLGDLFSGLGGLAGAASSLGWRPFRLPNG
jgi:hypothetical protein